MIEFKVRIRDGKVDCEALLSDLRRRGYTVQSAGPPRHVDACNLAETGAVIESNNGVTASFQVGPLLDGELACFIDRGCTCLSTDPSVEVMYDAVGEYRLKPVVDSGECTLTIGACAGSLSDAIVAGSRIFAGTR